MAKSHQNPDVHLFNSLDPEPLWGKKRIRNIVPGQTSKIQGLNSKNDLFSANGKYARVDFGVDKRWDYSMVYSQLPA